MKININRKPMSRQEIGERQNFGEVLEGAAANSLPFYKTWWFIGGTGMAIIASIIVAVSALTNNNPMPNSQASAEPVPTNTTKQTTPTTQGLSKPEAKGFDNNYISLWTESGKAKKLLVNNTTQIIVPNKHFVDADNKAVEGKVEIRYFESNTHVDVINNPNTVVSTDDDTETVTTQVTETANLQFWQNGKQVYASSNYPVLIKSSVVNQNENTVNKKLIVENNLDKTTHSVESVTPKKQVNPISSSSIEDDSNNFIASNNPTIIKQGEGSGENETITDKKPSFNISYPVDPNDSLQKALKSVLVEIKALEQEHFVKPIKMDTSKQNFTLKFDSIAHPELASFKETIFGVASDAYFTSALYKYRWSNALVQRNDDDSYTLQLSNATYIGEELFKFQAKVSDKKSWLRRLLDDLKGLFVRESRTEYTEEESTPTSKRSYTGSAALRLVPVDSSQYYYQRSDYRSPVQFKVFPVLTAEQYTIAIKEYENRVKQNQSKLLKKQAEEKAIRNAIKKRRDEILSKHRRKIEVYMGLTNDTDLQ